MTKQPLSVTEMFSSIPELPDARKARYIKRYQIAPADAEILVSEREVADYFEQAAEQCAYPKALSALMLGEVFRLLGAETAIPIPPEHLAQLAEFVGQEKISAAAAKKAVAALWEEQEEPSAYLDRMELWQQSDEGVLEPIARSAVRQCEKSAADYKRGKKQAIGAIIGQAMAETGGRGNAAILRRLIERILEE